MFSSLILSLIISYSDKHKNCVPQISHGKELTSPKFGPNSYLSDDLPPARFRKNNSVIVHFVNQDEITKICLAGTKPICGTTIIACTTEVRNKEGKVDMYLPNPCSKIWQTNKKDFGHYLCHELGHVNGWSSKHER